MVSNFKVATKLCHIVFDDAQVHIEWAWRSLNLTTRSILIIRFGESIQESIEFLAISHMWILQDMEKVGTKVAFFLNHKVLALLAFCGCEEVFDSTVDTIDSPNDVAWCQ